MNAGATVPDADLLEAVAAVRSRQDLSAFLHRLCERIGADRFLLSTVGQEHSGDPVRVLASDWTFDTIALVGPAALGELVAGAAGIGEPAEAMRPGRRERSGALRPTTRAVLADHGHGELYRLRIHAGRRRCHILFSAERIDAIDAAQLPSAQLLCCYLVSQLAGILFGSGGADMLSTRERECLYWVSEGKTTGEVATILGVTQNTVNSYLQHAIQKFAANNRAMAIATAIRTGAI